MFNIRVTDRANEDGCSEDGDAEDVETEELDDEEDEIDDEGQEYLEKLEKSVSQRQKNTQHRPILKYTSSFFFIQACMLLFHRGMTWLPWVREKSGKKYFFQVREF